MFSKLLVVFLNMAYHVLMNFDIDRNTGVIEGIGKFILAGIALNLFAVVAICQIFYSLGQGLLRSLGLIER